MVYLPKSEIVPECLEEERAKKSGKYNCEGVLDALKKDFKNKCYICEDKEPHTINIEHFRPHKEDKELKFDWNNLFYCCGHCNNTKLAKPEYDNILNCTVKSDEVETKMKYWIHPFPHELVQITELEDSIKVKNTAKLLDEVYNGTTILKLIESSNIRKKLLSEIRKFQDLLFKYKDDAYSEEDKEWFKQATIRELKFTSNFTAFKRWIIRQNHLLSEDFIEYIDE